MSVEIKVHLELELSVVFEPDGSNVIIESVWCEKPASQGATRAPLCCDLSDYITEDQEEYLRQQYWEWNQLQWEAKEAALEDRADGIRQERAAEQRAEANRLIRLQGERGKPV